MPTSRRGQIRRTRTKGNRNKGWVYVIHLEDDVYKLGKTLDVYSRRQELDRQCYHVTRIVWRMEVASMWLCERYLLRKYGGKRIKGEFFRLTSDDVEEIRALKSEGPGSLDELAIEAYPELDGSYRDWLQKWRRLEGH